MRKRILAAIVAAFISILSLVGLTSCSSEEKLPESLEYKDGSVVMVFYKGGNGIVYATLLDDGYASEKNPITFTYSFVDGKLRTSNFKPYDDIPMEVGYAYYEEKSILIRDADGKYVLDEDALPILDETKINFVYYICQASGNYTPEPGGIAFTIPKSDLPILKAMSEWTDVTQATTDASDATTSTTAA